MNKENFDEIREEFCAQHVKCEDIEYNKKNSKWKLKTNQQIQAVLYNNFMSDLV